jgi:glutaminyl-tRNA synthetase
MGMDVRIQNSSPQSRSAPPCLQLFKSASPEDTDDWLADMDKESEEVLTNVFISSRLEGCKPLERFQLERLGFFCVDRDTTASRVVLNRTCTLRDTYVRQGAGKKC